MDGEQIKEKILRLLSKNDYGLTIEEVARSLEINRMTASKYLAILEATRKITVREVGKAKLHYPKTKGNRKWLKLNNYKSSCGLNGISFAFLLFLFLTSIIFLSAITTANPNGGNQNFEISVTKDYTEKLIILEIQGPPLTDFSMTLINPENRSISPKDNVSFRTDQEGKYELHLIGFVPGYYLVKLVSNGTEYTEDFEIEPFVESECNRSFLEYRPENATNVTETNESVAGDYVWDICRDFVESSVTKEEVITGIVENRTFVESENVTNETIERSFVEEELNITEIAENRTFLENESVTNETVINETLERSFVEEELNITEIAENMTFVEREVNITNITETNESIPRLFIEKVVEFLPEKKKFGMNEKPKFKFTSKKIFSEQGKLIEEFAEPEVLNVFVYDPKQKMIDIRTDILKKGSGEYEIELSKGRAFRPGLYRIRIEVKEGNETYEMEDQFLWGVLAINTHKSIYLENEEAFIGIAVLDNEGHMVCDSEVTLEITDPNGTTTTLTTSDDTIKVSPECEVYGVTNLPDYYAYYAVNTEGTYTMKLTAVTRNGIRTMTDTFLVQKQVDFDVARDGPTRIYPPVKYRMVFTVKANRDYQGLIKEYVPSSFEITPQDGLTTTIAGDTKTLTWNKKLTAGETYQLAYEFDAPDISPYLFTLGALEIGNWKEAREWMIASDAPELEDLDATDCTIVVDEWCPDSVSALNTVDDPACDSSADNCLRIDRDDYADINLSTPAGAGKINNVTIFVRHNGENGISNYMNTSLVDLDTGGTLCYSEIPNVDTGWQTDNFTCTPTPTWAELDHVVIRMTNTDSPGSDDTYVEMVNVSIDYDPPPTWSNPDKNDTEIYKNEYVKFNTTWNDTLGLAGYKFSINQGGGWVNSSFVTFTGTGNVSENVSQITASANTVVQWRFYANDTGGNWNQTDIQQFTVLNPLRVKDVNVTPQKAKNATNINITANITDLFYSIDTAKAMLYYPNGTFWQNATMTGSDDIYYNETFTVNFYPHGTYNITIWANDTAGIVNSTETTWFAPYLNLSKEKNITINGSFTDWSGVTVVTDNGTDAVGGGVVDNELLITGLNSDAGNTSIFSYNSTTGKYEIVWSNSTAGMSSSSMSGGEIGDLTHDGMNDFAIARFDGINFLLEIWTYNSSSQEWYRVWFDSSFSSRVRVGDIGDFDNDTFTEILFTSGNIQIWGNDTYNATGFSLNKTLRSGCTYHKAAGDLNDNGVPEIVLQCASGGDIEVWEWNGTDYENKQNIPSPMSVIDDAECGDVDRDNVDECVICGSNQRSHVIDYSEGTYSIVYNSTKTPGDSNFTQTCSIGDVTNDGWPDWFDVSGAGVRVFSYNGTDYVNIWNGSSGEFANPDIAASFVGDSDNDGRGELLHHAFIALEDHKIIMWENDTVEATSFNNTFNWTSLADPMHIIIGDLDTDGGEGGTNEDFDLTNVSLANNNSYLFARIGVNGSIDVSDGTKYYRMFISTNDDVGNETTPENEDLPFKYDYRVQINGSSCYVFNYTDYGSNVSSCLFNYTGAEMEIGVNLTVINLSAEENANISFQTGSTNPGGYDSAPDGESFLSYDVPVEAITTSLGTNPVPGYGDADGSIVFDLKCSDFVAVGLDTLQLWGNWSGWHANQTNSSPVNNTWWNVTVNGIPEGTWKWDAWCNNTIGQEDWSNVNRMFVVDLTDPQIGSKYINESGTLDTDTIVCMNVSGVSDTNLETVWTTVTQSNGSVFNITMSDTGSCAGSPGDNWYSADVNVGDSNGKFYYNTTYVNDSSGRINSNTTVLNLTVQFIDNTSTASLGTNPIAYYNDSDGSIIFDLKCSDDVGVSSLKLYGNWSGWHANQTNSTPGNNVWWNVTVNGIPEGTWKWDAWCNDTIGQEDWSDVNRTFTVNLSCKYPASGNWNITNQQNCSNITITMNGNLTVQNNGNLTFRNVTLKMNSSSDGQYGINVQSGGAFYIYDNDDDKSTTSDASNITAVNTNYEFFFIVDSGSTFSMTNSQLSESGWWISVGQKGLEINTTVTEFSGNTLTNNANGVVFYSNNNIISNNTATSNGLYYGISLPTSSNNTLTNNTVTSNYHGIYLGDSSNNTLTNNTVTSNHRGIYLDNSSNNTLTNNTANSNDRSIYLDDSSNNTLTNNTVTSNSYGIYLAYDSSNNTLTNNTVTSNIRGIISSSSDNNNITQNSISENLIDTETLSSSNILFYNNAFTRNIKSAMISVSTTNQTPAINGLAEFNISVSYPNGTDCSDFTYNITTRPYETVNASTNGNNIIGNFTATRPGLYSLIINVTDSNNNTVKTNYPFLVNTTEAVVNYYFRAIDPTHGQPKGSDSRSLLLTPPTTEESWSCGGWIQGYPDDLTVYTPHFIKDINMSFWYKVGTTNNYTGVQRYGTYGGSKDYSQSVPSAATYTWINRNFAVNWSMDYAKSWYWLSVKLTGSTPVWMTNATNPSYVNISYLYTTTPEIKNNTNTDIFVLSATSPATDTNNATIYLDGTGSTNLTVQMFNTTITYTAKMDGNDCNTTSCNLTSQASGELNFTLTLASEHNITVEEGDNPPTTSLGTNPIAYYNDSDGSVTFDLKCSDDIGVDTLKLYGNWSGWHANQTNSSPGNDAWWNKTVSGIPEGVWKWDAWCNDTGGYEDWSDVNRTFTVDLNNPTASMGTNPVDYLNDSDGSIIFDLKCSDNFAVDTLQLWGNWTGSWAANQTNSTPINDTWWNKTVSDIPAGTWRWGVYCNDSSGREDWSVSNRTLTVDLTDPQIGSKYINESGSVNNNTIVCLNVSGISDNIGVDTVWTTVTQSNGSVFNVTMLDGGDCAGGLGDNWYSVNVNVGDSGGTFYYNTTYVNDSSGRVNSNTTVPNLTVTSPCNVDFTMSSELQVGILFSEQDPSQVNVSAVDNGDYNVTDNSNSGCGTVNVSVRATSNLINGSSVIGIGNVTVNSTSPGSETIQLSTTYQLIRSSVPAGTSNITTLYFWLTIPSSQDPRDYNTTIYIMEEME